MIKEGLELMVVGMGVVSSFLVLLVLLMKISGYLFNRNPEQVPTSPVPSPAGAGGVGGQKTTLSSAKISKAIAVAVAYQHQRGGSNQ